MIPPNAALAAVPPPEDRAMNFLDHLDVLRATLVRAAVVALTLVAVAWFFSDRLLEALIQTLAPGQHVLALAPAEAFSARINIALWTGGLLAVPYVMLEVWMFVAPGLKRTERRFAVPWMVASAVLLYSGLAFALGVILPLIVGMLASFATPHVEARVGLSALVEFATQLAAGCAILFQLPLVLCLLVWFRLVTPHVLARAWRHAVFFIALGAAIVTPGDGPSMLVLAAPLIVLYFLSVLVSWGIWKARGPKGGSDAPGD